MKKHMKKVISMILIAVMVMSRSVVMVSAEETTEEYNTVAHHHFAKTEGEVPENVQGTCSYVAASMLLSFYDSYWSDAFVASYFEGETKPSIGAYNDYPNGVPGLKLENAAWEDYERNGGFYSDFIYDSSSGESNTTQYLHLYLLSMGIAAGYYENYENSTDSEIFSTTLIELSAVLDNYFDIIFGPADYYRESGNADSSIPLNIFVKYENTPGESRQTVMDTIIEQVGSGNPVIYRGQRGDAASVENSDASNDIYLDDGVIGHVMVAFNIQDGGDVDLHLGWTENGDDPVYTSVNTTDYRDRIGVLWIEINEEILPHNCSNNYNWHSSTGTSLGCSCIAYSKIHPAHSHVFDNNAEECGASNATTRCTTCERYISTHNYCTDRYSEVEHWKECPCGATTPREQHDWVYNDLGTVTHSMSCDCGYSVTEDHVLENCMKRDTVTHIGTCACGRIATELHTLEDIGLGVMKCTKCPYSRKPTEDGGSGSVHLGIEEETDEEAA